MSEQDKSLLDEQASLVRAVYRALPEEEIPAEIEQRILANAASAIQPNGTRRWLQWSAPLASAAVVLLVVGIVMQPQSQREMVPEQQAVMVDLRQVAPPAVVTPSPTPPDEAAPRMMAQKPDLSARPKALEDARVRSSRPAVVAKPEAAAPAITTMTTVAPAMPKREESASAAFLPPALPAAERKQSEDDRESALADAGDAAGASGVAEVAASGSKRFSADESRRSKLMRTAPAAAAQTADRANPGADPALDISPALRARLEKFLDARGQANASGGELALEELRREYPGVDIDAALRALEQKGAEGAQ